MAKAKARAMAPPRQTVERMRGRPPHGTAALAVVVVLVLLAASVAVHALLEVVHEELVETAQVRVRVRVQGSGSGEGSDSG